jgi:hypothetical protein
MQMNDVKQRIDRIEECADDAERAVKSGNISSYLKQSVDQLHQQARQAQQACSSQQGHQADAQLRQPVMQLEQAADRAMQACQQAGSSVDPQLKEAIQRAHQEASSLKKQLQMG